MPRIIRPAPAPSSSAPSFNERPRTPLRTPAKPPRPVDGRGRPGRLSLMWRRQRRLLRPAAWALLALAVSFGLYATVRTVQPGSTIASWRERLGGAVDLAVQDVIVEGREKTPEPMLRAALGVSRGDKLLGFSLEAARARIEQLAWVQHATVERRLPGTIVVTLVERRPFAVWQSGGRFQLIDRQGEVVAEQDPAKDATAFATLPLVVGPGAPAAAAELLDLLAAQPQLRIRVTAAVRVGERRWNLRLNNGADVLLPEAHEAAALVRLMELQTSQQLLDRPLATVDLRLPDRLVVRPQPEPRPGAAPTPALRRPT